jgi:integrator complex subunit 1
MLLQVRVTSAPRLEMWLQNPKVMRPAQELLMSVCVNCSTHTQRDVEVISHLVKIRLKTKALINLYLSCIRYSDLVLKETPHRVHTGL